MNELTEGQKILLVEEYEAFERLAAIPSWLEAYLPNQDTSVASLAATSFPIPQQDNQDTKLSFRDSPPNVIGPPPFLLDKKQLSSEFNRCRKAAKTRYIQSICIAPGSSDLCPIGVLTFWKSTWELLEHQKKIKKTMEWLNRLSLMGSDTGSLARQVRDLLSVLRLDSKLWDGLNLAEGEVQLSDALEILDEDKWLSDEHLRLGVLLAAYRNSRVSIMDAYPPLPMTLEGTASFLHPTLAVPPAPRPDPTSLVAERLYVDWLTVSSIMDWINEGRPTTHPEPDGSILAPRLVVTYRQRLRTRPHGELVCVHLVNVGHCVVVVVSGTGEILYADSNDDGQTPSY
ncbi:hypothetical protein QFC24_006797 [Naganishia onofrii]|uniref:Uncharacterized protein n=1 Tax=Naganishia onofrii TaxID=1851511 RepID=A0ACC2WYJ2_9TREE|nr:hypothetical protein QFC24_006797 [Naganishia onofrii]